jgi:hypothetical protein
MPATGPDEAGTQDSNALPWVRLLGTARLVLIPIEFHGFPDLTDRRQLT